jgi:hypothetical protein
LRWHKTPAARLTLPTTSLRLAVSIGETVSATALRTLDGGCARGRFRPGSPAEERQLRLALAVAAQDVEFDADPGASGELPGRLAVAHGDDALATRLLGARHL